jgi:hypothetical protein
MATNTNSLGGKMQRWTSLTTTETPWDPNHQNIQFGAGNIKTWGSLCQRANMSPIHEDAEIDAEHVLRRWALSTGY